MSRRRTKGNCYRSAVDFLIDKHLSGESDKFVLVHGRPRLTRPPFIRFGHAWVEHDELCIDTEKNIWIPKFLYYHIGQIRPEENYYYTYEEMAQFLLGHRHYGPWQGIESEGLPRSKNTTERKAK